MGVTNLSQRTPQQGDNRLVYSRQFDLFGTSNDFAVGIGADNTGTIGPVVYGDSNDESFRIHHRGQIVKLRYPAYWQVMQYDNVGVDPLISRCLAITVIDLDTNTSTTYTQDRRDNFFTDIVTPVYMSGVDDDASSDDLSEAKAEVDEVVEGLLSYGGTTHLPDGTTFDLNNYNPKIVTRLKINTWDLDGFGKRHRIIVHYQACAVDQLAENGLDGSGPRYSPSLMKNLFERVTALENSNKYTNKFGTAHSAQDILDEDLSGAGAENYVHYEKHDFDIGLGINVIQPIKGAFYGHGVEVILPVYNRITLTPDNITMLRGLLQSGATVLLSYSDTEAILDASSHVSTMTNMVLTTAWLDKYESMIKRVTADAATHNVEDAGFSQYYSGSYVVVAGGNQSTGTIRLEEGKDFVVEAIDIPRTARAQNPDHVVYRHIRLLADGAAARSPDGDANPAREVLISYHAFGGEPSIDVIRSMHQDIENTRDILRESNLITTASLSQQSTIISLSNRIARMEEYHAHYNQIEHRVSIGHAGWHWFNIATIYNGNWNIPTSGTRDVGHFRIQSILRDWVYEFLVDVDMDREDDYKIHLVTVGSNQDSGYDIVNYQRILNRDNVAVRLCWVTDESGNSPDLNAGIVLQIGWNFNRYANHDFKVDTDSIIVTNKSSSASAWTLLQDPHQINYQAKGLVNVYNHRNLVRATQSNVTPETLSDHVFYKFQDKYVYVKTPDFYIKDGKKYFTYGYDSATGRYTYTDIATYDTTAHPEYTIGSPTGAVELYERRMWGRFPVQYVNRTVSFSMIGSSVTVIPSGGEFYIYDDATSSYVALDTSAASFSGVVTTQTIGSNTRRGMVISTMGNAPSTSVWNKGKFRTVFKATVADRYHPNSIEEIATGEFYLVSDDSYNEDTRFKMPNSSMYWSSTDDVRCKSCIRVLEPEDGIVAWIGNVPLAQFAPKYAGHCTLCDGKDYNNKAKLTSGSSSTTAQTLTLNGYTTPFGFDCTLQRFIKTKYIKRITAVVFDRRAGGYLVLDGAVSMAEAAVNSTIEKQPAEAFCNFLLDPDDLCTLSIAISKYKLTKRDENGTVVPQTTNDKAKRYGRVIMSDPVLVMQSPGYSDALFTATDIPCKRLYSDGGVLGTDYPNDVTEIFFATIQTNQGTNSLLNGRFDLRQIRIQL